MDDLIKSEWYDIQKSESLPRYARITLLPKILNEDDDQNVALDDGLADLNSLRAQNSLVPWLKRCEMLSLKADFPLIKSVAYQQGFIFGMDASSAFSCEVLDPQPGEKVLDLCCAPGGKLLYLADMMQRNGVLIGVDVSEDRLFTCRSLLRKYMADRTLDDQEVPWYISLVRFDGRLFDPKTCPKDKILWDSVEQGSIRRSNRSNRKKMTKRQKINVMEARETLISSIVPDLFDRVLVDAECTHDASMKHVSRTDKFVSRDVAEIQELQLALLKNGFKLLKPGGKLVYSTCSFLKGQNEDIILAFLESEPTAQVCAIENVGPGHASPHVPGAVSFIPSLSGTSGFFVCKLIKEKV